MRSITREQRMLAAAAANVLFIISLFFPWYGVGDLDFSGDDVIPVVVADADLRRRRGADPGRGRVQLRAARGDQPRRQRRRT